MTEATLYSSPLTSRYASPEMSHIFSATFKHLTWRRLWVALAKAQRSLGLPITEAQIKELETHLSTLDFAKIAEYEKRFRHDVMAHIHAYGDLCPGARGIIHLGATSSFVTDNTDLIQMREALVLLWAKCIHVLRSLTSFAEKHKGMATLSYTHYQSAQPTTVGKRACLWIQDLVLDVHDIEERVNHFHFLGAKGATGTQASFLALFNGDADKVKQLDQLVAKEAGFFHLFKVAAQTYPRKYDMRMFSVLSGLAASAHKFATDIRLLSNLKELEEPFGATQIGSSAMPYKRNPVCCERICGLARFLISLAENPAYTASTQWLERTLDDSSNRRLSIPEAFLCADAILNLLAHVTEGLVVHPKQIEKHLLEELPFLATENILMEAVKRGGDRQELHEKLRMHSFESARRMKEEAQGCDLLKRIERDSAFGLSNHELHEIASASQLTGRAEAQVEEYLREEVGPLLERTRSIQIPLPAVEV